MVDIISKNCFHFHPFYENTTNSRSKLDEDFQFVLKVLCASCCSIPKCYLSMRKLNKSISSIYIYLWSSKESIFIKTKLKHECRDHEKFSWSSKQNDKIYDWENSFTRKILKKLTLMFKTCRCLFEINTWIDVGEKRKCFNFRRYW